MNENLQNSTVHGIKKVLNASGLTLSLSDANLSLISQLILDSFTGLNSSCVIQCKWHIVDFLESSHVKEKLIQSIFNVDTCFNELRKSYCWMHITYETTLRLLFYIYEISLYLFKLLDKYLQYSNDGPTITSNLIEKLSQTLHCALSSKTLKKSDDIIKSKKQYLGFKQFKMSKIFGNDKLKTPKISNYYPSVQSSTYIMYSTNSMSYDYKSHLNFCKTCQKIRKFLIDEKNYVNSIQSIIILFRNVVFKSIESKMLADLIDKLDGCLELSVYIINMLEDESELQQGECRIPNFVNFFNQLCEIREFDVFIRYYELLDTCDWIREIHYYSNSYFYQLENDIDGLSTSLCRNYVYYFVLPLDRLEKYGNIFESIKTQNHSVPNDKIDSPFIHMKILIDNISNSQQNKQLKDITNGSAFINQINRFDSNSGPIYEGNLAIVEISKLKIAECYCCIDLNGNFYLYRINEKANLMPFKFKGIKKQTITLNLHKVVLQDYPNLSDLPLKIFELKNENKNVVLGCESESEKSAWLCYIGYFTNQKIIENQISVVEKETFSLTLKSMDNYIFSFGQNEKGIVFEKTTVENQEYSASEIYSHEIINCGSLVELIERLCYHKPINSKLRHVFLTTFTLFSSIEEIIDLLIKRFNIPINSTINTFANQMECSRSVVHRNFVLKYVIPVKLKVLNTLRMWLKFYWCDIFNYSSILYKLNEFLKDPFPYKGLNTYRKSILNLIKKLNTSCVDPKICSKVIYNEDFDILKVDSKLFAEQLTLYERKLFTYIPRAEFISILWSNKQKGSNLLRYIQHSTKFTYWIEKIIIETSINVERISVVSKIVDILEELYYINNFNAIFQIIAAFDCSAVYRLINTFSALASNRSKIINKCRLLTLNHYKIYKKRLKYISNPLPFLGIFLSNITFVNASTTTIVKNKETKSIYRLVNLKKCRKISSLISEIVNYQKITNQFNNDPNIQKMLSNIDPVKGKTEKEFENEMYKKSLQIQPRVS